jgi:hypothetical protein
MTPSTDTTGRFSRWWAELRTPSLKCVRLGHRMTERRQSVILDTDPDEDWWWNSRWVATEATEVTPTCARCGHTESMRLEDKRHLTGLTLPSDQMKALRRDGRILA